MQFQQLVVAGFLHRRRRSLVVGFTIMLFTLPVCAVLWRWRHVIQNSTTVASRLKEFEPDVALKWGPLFSAAGIPYPGHELTLVCFKDSKTLEVYGRSDGDAWKLLKTIPILAASGQAGPKLREGDRQVPEGIYQIESLNPNSRFHLALRLNYPNAFDREMGDRDGRTNLGSDIMIHGKSASIGCLAVGDRAAEELFVLAALVGPEHVQVVICPTDFRASAAAVPAAGPLWVTELYDSLHSALIPFPSSAMEPK